MRVQGLVGVLRIRLLHQFGQLQEWSQYTFSTEYPHLHTTNGGGSFVANCAIMIRRARHLLFSNLAGQSWRNATLVLGIGSQRSIRRLTPSAYAAHSIIMHEG
jgi:hypothetical protein